MEMVVVDIEDGEDLIDKDYKELDRDVKNIYLKTDDGKEKNEED